MTIGRVYLVGAGPGDPDLITRKGLRLIRNADVIIHDRLIPLDLLDEARPNAEIINAGKAPTKHRLSQDAINDAIIEHALAGKTVVRLKGGDPFIFGRGGEEGLVCARYGIPFEVVPGVSSVNAVPAYAGVPLTQRGVNSAFTVLTGHEDPDKPESALNYEALARGAGTLVILMGVGKLPQILERLINAGLDPETPAAIIERGTHASQRVLVAAAATLAERAVDANIRPPAITVIGEVVRLRDEGLRWFDQQLEEHTLEALTYAAI